MAQDHALRRLGDCLGVAARGPGAVILALRDESVALGGGVPEVDIDVARDFLRLLPGENTEDGPEVLDGLVNLRCGGDDGIVLA